MIAGILIKYIRKVKTFSKENTAYNIIHNVKFIGNKDELTLSCCDGNIGITQKLKQHGIPIIGEFCVNVFKLYDTLSRLPEQADIAITVNKKNYKLDIKTPTAKFQIPGYPPDQLFELSEHTTFKEINHDFFNKLDSIVKMNLDDSYPIVYNGEYIYYASPHLIIYVPETINIIPFKTNTKIAQKIFIDTFTEIDVTENQIHLRNENCRIFIPQINTKAPILDPIIKAAYEYNIIADVNVSELKSATGVIETLQSYDEFGIRSVQVNFEKNTLILNYQESEFLICDAKYIHPTKTTIRVPYDHLKLITGTAFVKDANYIKILLAENNKMFVAKRSSLFFVGGLSKI